MCVICFCVCVLWGREIQKLHNKFICNELESGDWQLWHTSLLSWYGSPLHSGHTWWGGFFYNARCKHLQLPLEFKLILSNVASCVCFLGHIGFFLLDLWKFALISAFRKWSYVPEICMCACVCIGDWCNECCVCVCVYRNVLVVNSAGWCEESGAWLLLQAVLSPYRPQCLISARASILLSPLIGKSWVRL